MEVPRGLSAGWPATITQVPEALIPHQPSCAVEIAKICPSGVRCIEISWNSPHSWHSFSQTKADVGSDLPLNTKPLCSPQAPHALLVFNNISPRPAYWLQCASELAQFALDVLKGWFQNNFPAKYMIKMHDYICLCSESWKAHTLCKPAPSEGKLKYVAGVITVVYHKC